MDLIFTFVFVLFLLYILSCVNFRRSLAEKVQLFQNLKKEEKPAEKSKVPPPVARRKNRKLASRFSTQVGDYYTWNHNLSFILLLCVH